MQEGLFSENYFLEQSSLFALHPSSPFISFVMPSHQKALTRRVVITLDVGHKTGSFVCLGKLKHILSFNNNGQAFGLIKMGYLLSLLEFFHSLHLILNYSCS